jgi:hypothetical protein
MSQTKVAPGDPVPEEFDDGEAPLEMILSEATMAEILEKTGKKCPSKVQVTQVADNCVQLTWGDGPPAYDSVLFDKEDVKAKIQPCPVPPQMVMKSKGVGLKLSGPGHSKKFYMNGDIPVDATEAEFTADDGSKIKYVIPSRACCGLHQIQQCVQIKAFVDKITCSEAPIMQVMKDGNVVAKLVPGPKPKCCAEEKIVMKVIDNEKNTLYTLRVPIDNCCDSMGCDIVKCCPAQCKFCLPACLIFLKCCKLPKCKGCCEYTDTAGNVAQWLGPMGTDYAPVAHTGSALRTHNFWPGTGSKDSFGDLMKQVDEKSVTAFSVIPFMELMESQFTESKWGTSASDYTSPFSAYKGVVGRNSNVAKGKRNSSKGKKK